MKLSAYLALASSIILATVAAWYSIVGLVAIFASAVVPIVIMGIAMETGKLVAANWLHRNWKHANFLIKTYLTLAVVILMFITSLGIFGFLSKAHLDQQLKSGGNNELQIENLIRRLEREQAIIRDSEKVMAQLDGAVETLQQYDRIRGPDGAIAVRASQAEERDALNESITNAYNRIEILQTELLPLQKQQISLEAEVGPLKYIAELVYGEDSKNHLDSAVRGVMLLLVSVFDPLAVVLLLAANNSFDRIKYSKMFTEQGEHIIDPSNVFIADEPVDFDIRSG